MFTINWACSPQIEHAHHKLSMFTINYACSPQIEHVHYKLSMFTTNYACSPTPSRLVQNQIQYHWWTCSIYGEHAQFMVNMLNLISWLDWPWKTTPKWPFECPNPSTGSKDTVIFILKSADLYSHSWFDLTIGLALKNYPKLTPHKLKSTH